MKSGEGEGLYSHDWIECCALLLIDHLGTITYANTEAASFFSFSPDEIGRHTMADLIPDADALIARAAAGEALLDHEVVVAAASSQQPLRMSFVPFRDAEMIRGIACFFTVAEQGAPHCPTPRGSGVLAAVLQDGRLVFASPSMAELSGTPLQEVLQRDLIDLVHAEDREAVLQALRGSVLSRDAARRTLFRLRSRSGALRWLDAVFSSWHWQGAPASAAIAFDVTESVEREAFYRCLFESIEETIACDELVLDAEGVPVDWIIREVNAAYEKTFCVKRADVLGQRASRVYGDEIVRSFLPAFSQAVMEQKAVRFDFHLREAERYFIVSAYPMGGLRFGTIGLDVSEHRRVEMEKERLLAELDAAINAIAEALIIYGQNGEILRMNPVAREFLRYDEKQKRRPLYERLSKLRVCDPGGAPYPLKEAFERVLGGETLRGELIIFHAPDGRQQWMSASAAPVYTADGRLLGAVGTASDVSRVRELQEEREVYLHTISHDLRTPLTVIQGHAQLLQARRGDGDFDPSESIDAILKGAQGMADMIDTLVDTAYLESGQLQLRKETLCVATFICDFLHRAEIVLDRQRIVVEIPPQLPAVLADPHRLERIVSNLLSNALKYSHAGSLVRLTAQAKGDEVEIAVHDQGPGIDPDDLPYIFERYYQTKRGRKGKGIGLGLYISRLLTEAHGGRIGASCEPGTGCVFYFTLPKA